MLCRSRAVRCLPSSASPSFPSVMTRPFLTGLLSHSSGLFARRCLIVLNMYVSFADPVLNSLFECWCHAPNSMVLHKSSFVLHHLGLGRRRKSSLKTHSGKLFPHGHIRRRSTGSVNPLILSDFRFWIQKAEKTGSMKSINPTVKLWQGTRIVKTRKGFGGKRISI